MSTYFLDTNIFLRMFDGEESGMSHDCSQLLSLVESGDIRAVTSSLVLAEIAWTLLRFYKKTKLETVTYLRSIMDLRGLTTIEKQQPYQAVIMYTESKVKFIDALIASISELQNHSWTLVSYDKDFRHLGVIRKEPKDIIREYKK